MMRGDEALIAQRLATQVRALDGTPADHDQLLDAIGDAPYVLLGEATHGTHEFYRERAAITVRLIKEKGFNAVAVEADWPDAYRVNRFVRGRGGDAEAIDALGGFERFPTWMWRNADVLEFVGWLRAHNEGRSDAAKTGFYGLDLYSLHASIDAVIAYLERVDPDGARRARERYACFDLFGPDAESYAYAVSAGLFASCEPAVVEQLVEMRRRAADLVARDGRIADDDFFYAEENARVAKNAERYYRTMLDPRVSSWNFRDTHMVETLERLADFVIRRTRHAKIVVWAHNSHVGDASATDMGARGELNIGQLMRRRHPMLTYHLGFTTYDGWVSAASDWHAPVEHKRLRPGSKGSYESIFHQTGVPAFFVDLRSQHPAIASLHGPFLERAVGVVYRPDTERQSHYFHAQLTDQFDGVVHFDRTRAVRPLERGNAWDDGEVPETFPSGV
ncbi:MAG TPA: erythromycin esterase family protein [Candidatus Eremiobacteraceae bacterium]|nr:erythromycin esterase family protein [Candidatus Eremiobacteraceae bacterium]